MRFDQLLRERARSGEVALMLAAGVGAQHGRAEQLGLEHEGIDQARAPESGLGLDQQPATAGAQRALQLPAEREQRLLAADQHRRREVGLGNAQRLVALEAGERIEPLHDLVRAART
jgi:hypothetical protein